MIKAHAQSPRRYYNPRSAGNAAKRALGEPILRDGTWAATMDLALIDPNFRISWALEWAYEHAPTTALPEWFFERLIRDFASSPNASLHRIYSKIICDAMRFRNIQPSDAQINTLAERTFDLVITQSTKTAVRFWCLEILSDLAPRLNWVANELPETLRSISQSSDCTPGMRVATREILRRLRAD